MTFWDRVLEKLSVPGLLALTLGIVLCTQAVRLSRLVLKEKGEKAVLPVRIAGLLLVALAAVILLDWIPGL